MAKEFFEYQNEADIEVDKKNLKKAKKLYEKALKELYKYNKDGMIDGDRAYCDVLEEKLHEVEDLMRNYMRIDKLSIENFRGFSTEESLEIKPLTLLYGANSAGKSSIFKSILLLKQTIEDRENKDNKLIPNGNSVKLGNFNEFINKHDITKSLKFKIDVNCHDWLYSKLNELFETCSFEFTFNINGLEHINLYTDNEFLISFAPQEKYFDHNQMKSSNAISISDFNENHYILEYFREKEKLKSFDPVSFKKELLKYLSYTMDAFSVDLIDTPDFLNSEKDELYNKFRKFIKEQMNVIFNVLRAITGRIYYLGPLRQNPERFYIADNNYNGYVGKTGADCIKILYEDKEICKQTSKWLQKLTNYSLKVTSLAQKTKETGEQNIYSIRLIDETTKTNVNISDVGFGISQILPIIVQSFTTEQGTILIEQPEIHLHPKLQAELGSMFAEACNNNRLIIETHSENLLLRIKKLIREKKLYKDDVSIIYVDKDEKGSTCIPIKLDENGDFINTWPNGFFEESFEELF